MSADSGSPTSPVKHALRRWRWPGAGVLFVLGCVLIGMALHGQGDPPAPPVQAATSAHHIDRGTSQRDGAHGAGETQASPRPSPGLDRSTPVALRIPAIHVTSSMLTLGLQPDGTVEVPRYSQSDTAGWFRYSPTPGEVGPAVIIGHVDSPAYGPGVFYRLGALRKGDTIRVRRADKTVAVFTVDKAVAYPKESFPTKNVYGDIDHPGLRLITCGGKYDSSAGGYQANTVVFASLTRTERSDSN